MRYEVSRCARGNVDVYEIESSDDRPLRLCMDDAQAEALAIALIQATPGDEQAAWFMADVGRVACPPHSNVMDPDDAIRLGLALIRAAKEEK